MGTRPVGVTVRASCAGAPRSAFQAIAPIDLSSIFIGLGPLPAVVGVRGQTGPWDRVGARREVVLSDGSSAPEQLTAHEPPGHFGYRVGPFSGPLGALVSHADGDWWFTAREGATHISWTYAFAPRPWRRGLVWLLVAPLWRLYARRVLARSVDAAERASSAQG